MNAYEILTSRPSKPTIGPSAGGGGGEGALEAGGREALATVLTGKLFLALYAQSSLGSLLQEGITAEFVALFTVLNAFLGWMQSLCNLLLMLLG